LGTLTAFAIAVKRPPRSWPGCARGRRLRLEDAASLIGIGDPSTLGAQIDKIRTRFGLQHVVLVGDRGMITKARIDAELRPAGLDWITALRPGDIKTLAQSGSGCISSAFIRWAIPN
jgi:hypothetical protein